MQQAQDIMPADQLNCYIEKSRHPLKAFDYFNFDQLDAFHNENVLRVLYGDHWYSVLITEQGSAFLNVFCKHKIDSSGWFDIEPLAGYGGAIVNTSDQSFIARSIQAYSEICLKENIIAEIIRFNCILGNHISFEKDSRIDVMPAKEIVIIECLQDPSLQLKQFSEACRRRVKRGLRDCEFRKLDKSSEWDKFVEFYHASLARVGAHKEWFLTPEFFQRARESDYFNVYSVWHQGRLSSASLVIEYPFAAYYLLAGNSSDLVPGAGELLMFGIAQIMAERGIKHFVLGGGNSAASDDPLLRFKKKFTPSTQMFYIGRIVHNHRVFNALCDEAIRTKPEIANKNFFLKYRL